MHELDCKPAGFEWRLQDSADASVIAHERISEKGERILAITNFTPVPHERFRLGVPTAGQYELILNTDSSQYAGSDFKVLPAVATKKVKSEGLPQSLLLRVPPLSTLYYKLID